MKKITLLIVVAVALVGLSVAWSMPWVQASVAPGLVPVNTPAAPGGNIGSVVHQLPLAVSQQRSQEPGQPEVRVPEQAAQADAYVQRALKHAQALRQAGKHFSVTSSGVGAGELVLPQSGSALAGGQCVDALMNPQMDVIEFGVTGTVDSWVNMWPIIYFDNTVYRSASHSLVMIDDYVYGDTDSFTTTFDYDEFGQGFQAPSGLVTVTVTYSRLYSNTNSGDTAYGNLWTLDSEGYLDELIDYWPIGETPDGWSDRGYLVTDTQELAALSGKPLALTFDMINDMVSPYEWIWLDDAQVNLCYTSGPVKVYLPLVIKSPPSGPTCTPLEPDSVNSRGSTMVGATCNGSFSFTDIKDYYSLNLGGVSNVRLCLTHLPAGSNWDALIYQDSGGSPYPLRCQIGTPGSGDKCKDCTLNTSESLFVLVSAGTPPPAGANTYQMSVASSTPTTPGIYGQVKYNGSPAAGIYLVLTYYNGSTWSTWGSPVATDSSGNYRFTGVPSLGNGQKYSVEYANGANGNALNTNYLAWWDSFNITSYSAGSNVAGGDFDIADVTLVSPAGGSTVTLPRTFTWNVRSAVTSDSYEFDIFDYADHNPWAYSDLLGYVGSFGLGSLPTGFSNGTQYCWDVWVYADNVYTHGGGESLYCRYVTFSTTAQGTEVTVNGQELNRFKTKDEGQHLPGK
jgi:hypothetical protein